MQSDRENVKFFIVHTDPWLKNGFEAWPLPETGLVLGFEPGMYERTNPSLLIYSKIFINICLMAGFGMPPIIGCDVQLKYLQDPGSLDNARQGLSGPARFGQMHNGRHSLTPAASIKVEFQRATSEWEITSQLGFVGTTLYYSCSREVCTLPSDGGNFYFRPGSRIRNMFPSDGESASRGCSDGSLIFLSPKQIILIDSPGECSGIFESS